MPRTRTVLVTALTIAMLLVPAGVMAGHHDSTPAADKANDDRRPDDAGPPADAGNETAGDERADNATAERSERADNATENRSNGLAKAAQNVPTFLSGLFEALFGGDDPSDEARSLRGNASAHAGGAADNASAASEDRGPPENVHTQASENRQSGFTEAIKHVPDKVRGFFQFILGGGHPSDADHGNTTDARPA